MNWVANIGVSTSSAIFALSVAGVSQAMSLVQSQADMVVEQLRVLPTPLPGLGPSNGSIQRMEQRRRELYEQLRQLGDDGVVALSRGLRDEDVELRKNVALAFNALAGGWFDRSWPTLDIRGG